MSTLKKAVPLFVTLFLIAIIFARPGLASCGDGTRPPGSTFWQTVIGVILGDESTQRSLGVGAFQALIDSFYIGMTGYPTDCFSDTSDWPDLNLTGQGTGLRNGSLLALSTSTLQGAVDRPPPATLALYFNGIKEDSPVFQEAQAATISNPFKSVYEIWKGFRNASYGLLAAFVLVISVMISMRSKIDPQTAVTAQAAIPRIIISAILITLSYGIGAIFDQSIGLGWNSPLVKIAGSFILETTGGGASVLKGVNPSLTTPPYSCSEISSISAASDCAAKVLLGPIGLGFILTIGLTLVVLVALVFLVIFLFALGAVYIFNYLKIIFLTIFSPLIFAIAAIPGQEHRIKDWFVDMLSAVLALPAIVLLIMLGFYLFLSVLWDSSTPTPGFWSTALSPLVGGMLMFGTWIVALRAPGMINAYLKPKK